MPVKQSNATRLINQALGSMYSYGLAKDEFAIDAGGEPTDWSDPDAIALDTVAFLRLAALDLSRQAVQITEAEFRAAKELVAKAADASNIYEWNDDPWTTKEDVQAAFRKAAEAGR